MCWTRQSRNTYAIGFNCVHYAQIFAHLFFVQFNMGAAAAWSRKGWDGVQDAEAPLCPLEATSGQLTLQFAVCAFWQTCSVCHIYIVWTMQCAVVQTLVCSVPNVLCTLCTMNCAHHRGEHWCAKCIVCTLNHKLCTAPWQTLPLATATNFPGKERQCPETCAAEPLKDGK